MVRIRPSWVVAVVCALVGFMRAQQPSSPEPQSPRQAILEMFSGDDAAFKKHLTQEMQAKIDELSKSSSPANASPLQTISAAKAAEAGNLEKFESGPVLFSLNKDQEHGRLEIHIDGDELRGEEDDMVLSVHVFRKGVEQELPVRLRLLLGWKQQQNVWRLNEVIVSARVPVGDPRILDKSWRNPPEVGPLAALFSLANPFDLRPPIAASSATPASSPTPGPANDHPRMTPARSVRLIGLAENIYARKHPEAGFTCSLTELVEIGKGLDNGEIYKFMDPEFAEGVYNGYRFALSGCSGKPVKAFRIVAEPLSGAGRAYCSDSTQELRAADDGHGASCLASGKPVRH